MSCLNRSLNAVCSRYGGRAKNGGGGVAGAAPVGLTPPLPGMTTGVGAPPHWNEPVALCTRGEGEEGTDKRRLDDEEDAPPPEAAAANDANGREGMREVLTVGLVGAGEGPWCAKEAGTLAAEVMSVAEYGTGDETGIGVAP